MIDPNTLSAVDRYRLLIGCIVPRPIAWVTTINAQGVVNLAPFSFFNGITASPLTVMISIGHRHPIKDTLRNLRENQQAVVHLVDSDQLEACHVSGGEYAETVSESEHLDLPTQPSAVVAVPRLSAATVACECRLSQEILVGDPPATCCFLEVLRIHINPAVCKDDGMPDPDRLRAVARLGERAYLSASGWNVVHQPRQVVPEELKRTP